MSAPTPALLAAKFHRPAGYGKTTLAAEWVAGLDRPVVWLALDEADNGPLRFCVHFVAALQHADPAVGTELLPPARNDLSEIALKPDGTRWLMKKGARGF